MIAESKGKSLDLFFVDGKPDGMLIATVFNWTGHVLVAPRTQLADALKREQVHATGVYLLIGDKEGSPLAYVGEIEDISDRIRTHDSKKDWWNSAILVTSAARDLNKSHVKYLEARLIEEARGAGRTALENLSTPTRPILTEAQTANMETFLNYILMVLPAVRVDMFLKNTRPVERRENSAVQDGARYTFELRSNKHGLHATADLIDGEFVVRAGSPARKSWDHKGSENTTYGQLFSELVRQGILQESGAHRVFRESYAFRSPSAAAAVVRGQTANGTIEWKLVGTSTTYKKWEEERLARDAGEVRS